MPERPDLEYVVPILGRELTGKSITAVHVDKPVVLRVALRDPVTVIVGRTITGVRRRAHFVLFALDGTPPLTIAVAPMLAGRFALADPTTKNDARAGAGGRSRRPPRLATGRTASVNAPPPRPDDPSTTGPTASAVAPPPPSDLALTLTLSDGRALWYRDDVQMGKVYVIEAAHEAQVPGLATVGVDVLDAKAFTRPAFRALAKKRKDQVKVFLMDKTALDSMGNAYADEVLFEARIHPKTFVRSLADDEVDRLHDAIVKVLSEARDEVARRQPATDEKVRDFLKVRNRHGTPCPRCGAKIRKAGVHGHDAFFCPECQPDGRKTALVDFRNVKR